jgi:hypothetical protein
LGQTPHAFVLEPRYLGLQPSKPELLASPCQIGLRKAVLLTHDLQLGSDLPGKIVGELFKRL